MRKMRIILSILAALIIVLFSLATLFKVPYYKVLFEVGGLKIRALYISIIFCLLLVTVHIFMFFLNKGRKIIRYILIIFCIAYCILMQSFVVKHSAFEIEEQVIQLYNCKDIQNYYDIHYCYFGKTTGELNIYYNNSVKTDDKDNIKSIKMVVIGDDYYKEREEYEISENKRIWIQKDVCQIDIKESVCDSYHISHIDHLNYFVILNDRKVYDMGTVHESSFFPRLFARGDSTEYYDWITMKKLYIQVIVTLIILLILNLMDERIERKLLDKKIEHVIDAMIQFYARLHYVYKITDFNLRDIKLEIFRTNNMVEVNAYRNTDTKEKVVMLRISEEDLKMIGLKEFAGVMKDVLADLTGSDYETEARELEYKVAMLLEPLMQEGMKL